MNAIGQSAPLTNMETRRPSRGQHTAERVYQRTYKACISCRQRKAKCELGTGEDGATLGPPCARCRREHKECLFSEKRAWERGKKRYIEDGVDTPSPRTRRRRSNDASDRHGSYDMSEYGPSPGSNETTITENTVGVNGSSQNTQQPTSSLGNSMMRTVVASGNDALNILFEAAAAHSRGNGMTTGSQPGNAISSESRNTMNEDSLEGGYSGHFEGSTRTVHPVEISRVSKEVIDVWESCRFVKMGWFTSREAVTFIDLFFKNMSPLSPILTDFYANHANHYCLLTRDPVLCCTILMVSARYHVLPGAGGKSRNFFIHHRLWQHCQQLITRLIFGQDKSTSSKIRGIGTIEALLLMSEWHPRSLHFPPEVDGWDCDLMTGTTESRANADEADTLSADRWLEDMIEPARRSDQMSWMLLGSALSLAHELGIFEVGDKEPGSPSEPEGLMPSDQMKFRKQRVQRLLYVYINQLAWRIGCISLMPQSLNHAIIGGQATRELSRSGDGWFTFMDSWMDLTKLAKSVTDTFFPSVSFARQQLHSGRYIDLLDHFRPLLTQWKEKYLRPQLLDKPFFNILFIEYHIVRVYTHSVGMQAVVERVLADGEPNLEEVRPLNIDSIDYEYIQEVIDGCCQILQKVSQLAETGALRFSPVRTFLRITSSSIFLMKALSLGARQAKLRESLDILEKTIQALKSNALDDIHLSSRYATLLDLHVLRLRRNLLVSPKGMKNSRGTTTASSTGPPSRPDNGTSNNNATMVNSTPISRGMSDISFIPSLNDMAADDWLSLPFDPSMAPFGISSGGQIPALEGGALDFIWNLPS